MQYGNRHMLTAKYLQECEKLLSLQFAELSVYLMDPSVN